MNNSSAKDQQPQTAPESLSEVQQNRRAALLANGEITLAQYVGLGKDELYAIARQAHQLLNSGKLEEARDLYQGLVAADPFDSVFHCHLGAAQLRLNEPDAAFEQFNLALQYNIANVDAFVGRAEILLARGDLTAAVADFKKALELDSEGARASTLRARAKLLALKDQLEKAASSDAAKTGK